MKNVASILSAIILLFGLSSCTAAPVTKIELGQFPDNIVYYVGESDSIDLTGGTVNVFFDYLTCEPYVEHPMDWPTTWEIVYDIDFSVPGVYDVYLMWEDGEIGRFPVQIIERCCE
jgi:hypothetical protein